MDRLRRGAGASDSGDVQLKRDGRAARGAGDDQASRRTRQDAVGSSGAAEAGGQAAGGAEQAGGADPTAGGGGAGAGAWQADAGLNSALGIEDGEGADLEPSADGSPRRARARAAGAGRDKQGAGGGDAGASPSAGQAGGGAGAQQGGGASAKPSAVQRKSTGGAGGEAVHQAAAQGIAGGAAPLPHLDAIQASFGDHDVSGVQAHTGGEAARANRMMGAEAYATGQHVAFASGSPSLHTAAHEAAHVVQQRGGVQLAGGVGAAGDAHEQQADAVADRVVAGRSAADILDRAAGPAGAGAAAVQHRMVQLAIKEDLREAMKGWGTDEDAIYNRLQRASTGELREVMGDPALMAELRDELDQSEMSRVLDLLQAPLAEKLRLAMSGWGTDEEYIHHSLERASPPELLAVANDPALLAQLEDELSGEDLRRVLDRLNVPLERKIRFAVRGWGTDEQYIYTSIAAAPIDQVKAVARDATVMGLLDDDLSESEDAYVRGLMARRIHLQGADPNLAFSLLTADDDKLRNTRLAQYGGIAEQRGLCDAVIAAGTSLDRVVQAFESYWNVDTSVAAGVSAWDVKTLQMVHAQCKLLPEQDVRSGGWTQLIRNAGTGASMNSGGEFKIGAGAAGVDTQPYGVGTELSAAAEAGTSTLTVKDPGVFAVGATVAMGPRPSADVHAITAISGQTYTLDGNLAARQETGTRVTPDDATAIRDVSWVAAVVRHEIAHAVDNVVGASAFYALGGWWSGDDFDTWAAQMGSPWSTNDGSTISEDDRKAIKDAIVAAKGTAGGTAINASLAADHALNRYWSKGVPVIDAANASISRGQTYWNDPEVVPAHSGKRFAVNLYYKKFQYYNEQVHSARVRSYMVFSPAEFFAEVYTVYYEEAGKVPDTDLGRLVPVSSWRDWIKRNVHDRGHAPATSAGGAPTAGVKAGNPGM
ncbi:MAG TPA: DUF4157 domain-containing protein [Kofleriaceae bacterium]|nr:DUF4157 domain-containing protein [Kofleriaceae bacterium]